MSTSQGFQPFVPATESRPEFTVRAILLGCVFGLLFGAVTVYVGLRAGLTVAASIPISVLVDQRAAGAGQSIDSGKQHRPDDGQRGAVDCGGCDLYASRADLPRLRPGILAHLYPRAAGRLAGRAVYDSAAATADRRRAWQADVSGRHGMRGCAAGGRTWRIVRKPRVSRAGAGRHLHASSRTTTSSARGRGSRTISRIGASSTFERRGDSRRCHAGVSGRGLHHRTASGGNACLPEAFSRGWC